MLERMDEQMKTLNRAYMKELNNIEESFYSERRDVLQAHKNKQFVFINPFILLFSFYITFYITFYIPFLISYSLYKIKIIKISIPICNSQF